MCWIPSRLYERNIIIKQSRFLAARTPPHILLCFTWESLENQWADAYILAKNASNSALLAKIKPSANSPHHTDPSIQKLPLTKIKKIPPVRTNLGRF